MSERRHRLVELTAGGLRWQVLPECRELLLSADGLRLPEWLNAGQARVVKHGPHRTVYRVRLPGLDFYLKHYRLADGRSWLRQLLRPSKARKEFTRALAVAARAVPTVAPVAVGENHLASGPGESFLLTRSLEGAEPLSAFLESTLPTLAPGRRARLRQRLAVTLGRFVARLHHAGIRHDDLHAANLLLRLEADDEPRLYLIDLHDVRLGRPLPWPASRDNLVLLNRWFILRSSRADRLRFWRAYREARALCRAEPDEEARDLERRTWDSNLQFWRGRDRRCLVTNRYYLRLAAPGTAGYAVSDLDTEALAELLADPDWPFREPGAALLKDSRSSTVAELKLPVGGVRRQVILKRFRVAGWLDAWLNLFRRSPALRSWVHGHGLRERCLPTARPLAVFHRTRFGLWREGYLLTEKVANAADLHEHLAALGRLLPAEHRWRLRAGVEQLARLVRTLHERNLSHRDLKAANVLVSEGKLWLIDLVGLRLCRRLSRRPRVRNLARLHASFLAVAGVSRSDKLRFLRVYLQWGLFGRAGWKSWWREIDSATRAKVERNRRSGRPLA